MSTSVFQAKIGREKEVETTLRRLRGNNVDISQEAAEIRVPLSTLTCQRKLLNMSIVLFELTFTFVHSCEN